ncbi:alanyl-tRNA synthetase [Streptacidiphilus sp. MAP12-33]|uniref:lytic transglycosylase domain-containing protein n=1 Tax=Streptacidiphilus sp. MAP12-33 TaxID=3156266 RepID=UPI003513D347
MRHRKPSSLARLARIAVVRVDKRITAGVGAALLVTGAATGTAVALNGGGSSTHLADPAAAAAVVRPTADTANRSEQRTALASASAAAQASARASAQAAAQASASASASASAVAKAKAEAAAKLQAAAQAQAAAAAAAKAKAQAAAQAQAAAAAKAQAAAAAAASASAAAAPTYSNDLSGWIAQAQAILAADGDHVPPAAAIEARAMTESSGDPKAVNNWDSNAAAGTPSEGLMQTIVPTFDTYALPGHTDIWNPVDNIVAAVRYANATYGAFENIAYGSQGY